MNRILGQDQAVATLRDALRTGRLHHAWIFSGPKGVGKYTTAVEFARILLDPGAGPDDAGAIEADPGSRSAQLIDAGSHPDLHVIRKELALVSDIAQLRTRKLSNIPLDVLREHIIGGRTSDDRFHEGPANLTSSLGAGKVFIVDEAELIDRYGQHALLKTLEEPPARTYIILITARPERLLPTMHSRCQHVRFGFLSEEPMSEWFARSGKSLEPDERTWVETFAEGSPGLAALAVDYGFYAWQRVLDPLLADLHAGAFPVTMGDTLAELAENYAVAWVKNHRNASKDAANKDATRHLLALLASHARRHLVDDPDRWIAVIDLLRAAEAQLGSNVNMKQALENLVVQWSRLGRLAHA